MLRYNSCLLEQPIPITTTTRRSTTRRTRPTTPSYWQTKTTAPYAIPTTNRPTTTQSLESCVNGQYYPHEECTGFYVCVNGQLVTQKCAPGLQWSVTAGMCDWIYKVKCIGRRKYGEPSQKIVRGRFNQTFKIKYFK